MYIELALVWEMRRERGKEEQGAERRRECGQQSTVLAGVPPCPSHRPLSLVGDPPNDPTRNQKSQRRIISL